MPEAERRKPSRQMDDSCEWTLQFRRVPPRIGDDFQVSTLPEAAGSAVYAAACKTNAATDVDVPPTSISPYVGHKCVPIWSPRGQHFSETEDFISLFSRRQARRSKSKATHEALLAIFRGVDCDSFLALFGAKAILETAMATNQSEQVQLFAALQDAALETTESIRNALREMILDVRAEARAAAAKAAETSNAESGETASEAEAANSVQTSMPSDDVAPAVDNIVGATASGTAEAESPNAASPQTAPGDGAAAAPEPKVDSTVVTNTSSLPSTTQPQAASAPSPAAAGPVVDAPELAPTPTAEATAEEAASSSAAAADAQEAAQTDSTDDDEPLDVITAQHVELLQSHNMLLSTLSGLSGAQEAAVTRGSASRVPAIAMEEPVTAALLARVLAVARLFTRLVVQQAATDGTPLVGLAAWRAMPHPFKPVSQLLEGDYPANAPEPPAGVREAVDASCLPPLMLHSREVPWHHAEVLRFASAFAKMGKDFTLIGTSVGSRTVQQTVAYYYGPWRSTPFYKRYVEQKLTKTEAQLNHEWQAYRSRAWFHFWRFDDSALTEQELAAGVLQLVEPSMDGSSAEGSKRKRGAKGTAPSILAPMRNQMPLMLLTDPLFVDCSPSDDSTSDPGSEAAGGVRGGSSVPASPVAGGGDAGSGAASPALPASALVDVLTAPADTEPPLTADEHAQAVAVAQEGTDVTHQAASKEDSWGAVLGTGNDTSAASQDAPAGAGASPILATQAASATAVAIPAAAGVIAPNESAQASAAPVASAPEADAETEGSARTRPAQAGVSPVADEEADVELAVGGPSVDTPPAAEEGAPEAAVDEEAGAVEAHAEDVMKGHGEGRAFPSFVNDIVGTLAEVGVDCAAVRAFEAEGSSEAGNGEAAQAVQQDAVHSDSGGDGSTADDGGQGAAPAKSRSSMLVSGVRRSGRRRRRSSMLGHSSDEDSDDGSQAPSDEGGAAAAPSAHDGRAVARASRRRSGSTSAPQGSVSLLETLDRQHAEMPHASRKSLAGAVSWTKDRDIDNEPFCTLCGDGGDLVCCDGDCRRSFHMDCIAKANLVVKGAIRDTPGLAQDALLSRLLDIDKDHWTCLNCATGVHDCFLCGSPGMAGVHVFRCQRMCGKYYHTECLAADPRTMWFSPPGTPLTTQAQEGSQPTPSQPAFSCPFHSCTECGAPFDAFKPRTTVYRCQACPTAYHASCLPAEARMDVNEVVTCNHGAAHATKRFDSQYHSGVSLFVAPPPKAGHSAAPPGTAAAAASELVVPLPEDDVDPASVPSRLVAHAEAVSKLRPNTVPWWFAASTSHTPDEFTYKDSATAALAAAVAFVSGAGYSSSTKSVAAPPAEAHAVHTAQGGKPAPPAKRKGLLDVAVHLGVTPGQNTLPDAPLLSPDLSQVDYGLVACSDRLGPRLEAPSTEYTPPKAVPFSSQKGTAMLLSGTDAAFARTLGLTNDEIIAMCQLVSDDTLSLLGMHLASQGSKPPAPVKPVGAVAAAAIAAAAVPPPPPKPTSSLLQHVGPSLGMRHATDWQSARKASFPKQPKWIRELGSVTPSVKKALALAAAEWNTGVRVSTQGEAVRMNMAQEVVTPTLQSKFTGTKRVKAGRNKWYARLFVDGKVTDICTFPGEVDAACAWDDVCYALNGGQVYTNFPFGIASLQQLQDFSAEKLPVPGGTVDEAKRLFLMHLRAVRPGADPSSLGMDLPADGPTPPLVWELPKSHPRYRAATDAEKAAHASKQGADAELDASPPAGQEDASQAGDSNDTAAPDANVGADDDGDVQLDSNAPEMSPASRDAASPAEQGASAVAEQQAQAQTDDAEAETEAAAAAQAEAQPKAEEAEAQAAAAAAAAKAQEEALPGLTFEDVAGGVHLTYAKARCKRSIARLFHVRKLIALAQRCSMLKGLSNLGGAHSTALQSAAARNGALCAQRLAFLDGARHSTCLHEKPQQVSFGKSVTKNMPPSLASWLASVALLGDGAMNGSVQGHWAKVGPHVQHLHMLAGTVSSGLGEAAGKRGKDDSGFAYSFDMSVPVDTSRLKTTPPGQAPTAAGGPLSAEALSQLIPHPEYAGVFAVGEEAVEVVQDREALGADGVYFAEAGGVEGDTVPSTSFSAPRWLATVQMPRKGSKDARGRTVQAGLVVLGAFESDADAARAHDREMVHLFGAGEKLNFPEDWGLAPSLASRSSKPADYPPAPGLVPLTQPQRSMQQQLAAAIQRGKHYSTALSAISAAAGAGAHAGGADEDSESEYHGSTEVTRSGRMGGRKRPAQGARDSGASKKRRGMALDAVASTIPYAAGNLARHPPLDTDAQSAPPGAMSGRSLYAGVTPAWEADERGHMQLRWAARIMNAKDHSVEHLGVFRTEVGAARAFDAAAYTRRRADAMLNFPEEWGLPASSCALKRVQRRSWESAVAAVQLDSRGNLRVPPGESRDVYPLCSFVAGADPAVPVGEEHCSLFGVVRVSDAAWVAFLPMQRGEANLGRGSEPVRLRLGQYSLAYNAARVVDYFNIAYHGVDGANTEGRWMNFPDEADAFAEQLRSGQGLPAGLLAPIGGFGEAAPSIETRRTALLMASQIGIGKGILKGPPSVPGTTAPLSVEGTPEDLAAAIAAADIGTEGPLTAKEQAAIAAASAAAEAEAKSSKPAPAAKASAQAGGTKRPRAAEPVQSSAPASASATSSGLTVTVSSADIARPAKRAAVVSTTPSAATSSGSSKYRHTSTSATSSFGNGDAARMSTDSAIRRAEAHAAAAAAHMSPVPTGPLRPDTTLIASMAKAVQTALHPLHSAVAQAWQNTDMYPHAFRSAMGDTQSAAAVAAATGAFAAFGPAASVTGPPGAGHVSTQWLRHLQLADECRPDPQAADSGDAFDSLVDDAPGLVPTVGPLSALCTLTECAANTGGDLAHETLRALKTHRRQMVALNEALGGPMLHSVSLPRKFIRSDALAEASCVGPQPAQGSAAAAAAGVTCEASSAGEQPLLAGAFAWAEESPMLVSSLRWAPGAAARQRANTGAAPSGLKVRLRLTREGALQDENTAPTGALPVNPSSNGGSATAIGAMRRGGDRWGPWLEDTTPLPHDLRTAPSHAPVYLPSMVSAAPVMFSRLAAVPPNAMPPSQAASAGKLEAHAAATRLSTLHVRYVPELEQAALPGTAPEPTDVAAEALRKVAHVAVLCAQSNEGGQRSQGAAASVE